jgi:type VI secretion system secreted protein Hcp
MAVDMFLELDGIKGETIDKVYKPKNAMDVRSFNWGLSNTGTFHHGSGGGSGKANFQTADLMLMCANGKHIAKGVLTCRKAGEKPLEYMKITMSEVLVSSFATGSAADDERHTETITLNFAKVKVEYFMQNASGSKEPGGEMAFDIAGNSKE